MDIRDWPRSKNVTDIRGWGPERLAEIATSGLGDQRPTHTNVDRISPEEITQGRIARALNTIKMRWRLMDVLR